MHPPAAICDRPLEELHVRRKFGVTVIGTKSSGDPFEYATGRTVLTEGDVAILSGTSGDLERFSALGD